MKKSVMALVAVLVIICSIFSVQTEVTKADTYAVDGDEESRDINAPINEWQYQNVEAEERGKTVEENSRKYSYALLNFDWAMIDKVGHQIQGLYACSCFSMAYMKTILDKRVHEWYEYNENGNDQSNVNCGWTNYECGVVTGDKSQLLETCYNEICNGKPAILYVTGRGSIEHYVTVIGVENVPKTGTLTEGNFIIIDPVVQYSAPENLGNVGYSLKSKIICDNVHDSVGFSKVVPFECSKHDFKDSRCTKCGTWLPYKNDNLSVNKGTYSAVQNTAIRIHAYENSTAANGDPEVSVPQNASVVVTGAVSNGYGNKWYKVKYGTKEGYIYAERLEYLNSYTNQYYIDLNGILDGTEANNISGWGTCDIYVNGSCVANDVSDYYEQWPYGTSFYVSDIKTTADKKLEEYTISEAMHIDMGLLNNNFYFLSNKKATIQIKIKSTGSWAVMTSEEVHLKNVQAGMLLNVTDQGNFNGANVDVWKDIGTDAQKWLIYKTGSNDGYNMRPKYTSRVLNMWGSTAQSGANATLYDYTGDGTQLVKFRKVSDNRYTIHLVADTNLVLDVNENDSCVWATYKEGNTSQIWEVYSTTQKPINTPISEELAIEKITNAWYGVSIRWNLPEGTPVKVYRKKSGASSWQYIATSTDTGYYDTTAENHCAYDYHIEVENGSTKKVGESISTFYMIPPEIQSVENIQGGVKVTWSAVPGADGYYVYRKDTRAGTWHFVGGTQKNLYFNDTSTNNGVVYYYAIKSFSKNGGTSIAGISASSPAKNTVYVKNVFISSIENPRPGDFTVVHSINNQATGYQIAYSMNSNMSRSKYVTQAGGSYTNIKATGLTKGMTYYVMVRPYKTVAGYTFYGAWSAKKVVTITR